MEDWIGSILDCSAILRKCSEVAGKSLRKVSHQRNPFSPKNGPALVFLPLFSHRLEAAQGKYGFHVNAVVDLEHSSREPSVNYALCNRSSERLFPMAAAASIFNYIQNGAPYFIKEHLFQCLLKGVTQLFDGIFWCKMTMCFS